MAWPTTTIDTTNMDASGDDASQARAEIKKMADNVNSIKDAKGQVNGIAELDSGSLLPTAQLPVVPVNKGGTNQTAYTIGDILIATGTTTLTKLAAGTSGYVFKSNGPGVAPSWQQEGGGLVSTTRIMFQQTTAPVGWTKETNAAYNDVALRVVTGSVSNGGADTFSTVFGASKTTASHTLTISQIPSHAHNVNTDAGSPVVYSAGKGIVRNGSVWGNGSHTASAEIVVAEGGGGSHSHGLTMDLKYRDVIIAQKD
jgi:microcystin-dependent protein